MRRKMNPKAMKKAMKRMGINVEEMQDVTEVIIRRADRELIIMNPQVTAIKTGGQDSFQISGKVEEKVLGEEITTSKIKEVGTVENIKIPIEDIKLVASQASVSPEEAEEALKVTKGNLAQAILNLKNK